MAQPLLSPDADRITQAQLAREVRVSGYTAATWVRKGIIPRRVDGWLDRAACLEALQRAGLPRHDHDRTPKPPPPKGTPGLRIRRPTSRPQSSTTGPSSTTAEVRDGEIDTNMVLTEAGETDRTADTPVDFTDARRANEILRVRERRFTVRRLEQSWVPVSRAKATVEEVFRTIREHLQSMPASAADVLAAETGGDPRLTVLGLERIARTLLEAVAGVTFRMAEASAEAPEESPEPTP